MHIEIFVDGACRGLGQGKTKSVGEGACAVVIYKNRKKVAQYARALGKSTNNTAEYEALITALLMCVMSDYKDPIIYSDSSVVVNQVSGKWKCSNENLIPLLFAVQTIKNEYRFRLQQVPRSYVWQADELANECLDKLEKEFEKTRK